MSNIIYMKSRLTDREKVRLKKAEYIEDTLKEIRKEYEHEHKQIRFISLFSNVLYFVVGIFIGCFLG